MKTLDSIELNDLDTRVLSIIRDGFPEDEISYNFDTGIYSISEDVYNKFLKISEENPYINGFESNDEYEEFFFEEQEDIVRYLEEASFDIYNMIGAEKLHITPQQFYRGLYYDNDTGTTCYKVFSLIAKFVVRNIINKIVYHLESK